MSPTVVALVSLLAVAAALVVAGLRWLRVAQREHYLPGRVQRIARLWAARSPLDLALMGLGLVVAVGAVVAGLADAPGVALAGVVLAAALGAAVPLGLSPVGRTSKLGRTARLGRLTSAWLVLVGVLGAVAVLVAGWPALALLAVTVPLTLDAALAVTGVIEKRLSLPFVLSAQRRLARVRPQVVAITGSYGKTSTKGYVAHLLAGSRTVVASPASFNNRLGLSRAVNDVLVDGTDVFVAEMGTYGPGEIRELCELFPPDVAVITTVGEAHLERMRTHATILSAKSEITERAGTVVLPVDTPELAALAERCRAAGKRVVAVATAPDAAGQGPTPDVVVDLAAGRATVPGEDGPVELAVGAGVAHAVNLAVALGVAHVLGTGPGDLARRLDALPRAAHRAEVQDSGTGLLVVDDTYNANPIGARAAVEEAAALAAGRGGPLVVVTPGIVELGHVQVERNADFAEAAGRAGAHVIVVGRTNRAALLAGAARAGAEVTVVDRREQAVPVATRLAADRGVILYENDLPDHYP